MVDLTSKNGGARVVQKGSQIRVEYIGKLENGMVFTKSSEDGDLSFTVGEYLVLKGLNDAVVGMKVGEVKEVILTPKEGFGEHDHKKIMTVQKNELAFEVKKNMQLKAQNSQGEEVIFKVTDVSDDGTVTLDGNHLLAGYPLHIKVKVKEILDDFLLQ